MVQITSLTDIFFQSDDWLFGRINGLFELFQKHKSTKTQVKAMSQEEIWADFCQEKLYSMNSYSITVITTATRNQEALN